MNKQYPLDKWVNKYFTPRNFLGVIAIGALFVWLSWSHIISVNTTIAVCLSILLGFLVLSIIYMIGGVYWTIKHPVTVEYCKECNQRLPIKYEK